MTEIMQKIRSARFFTEKKWKNLLWYLLPPAVVGFLILLSFGIGGLYPFGEKSVSWCDMDSQIVPLLCDLKDALSGKASMVYSAANAAGANFTALFFFYLSSPFHFLVVFVAKADMRAFVNVLVLLKLMTASVTAFVYLKKRFPNLHPALSAALAVFYGLCNYAMIYYQILLWLDMVYLFPLLLLGVEKLIREGKTVLFTVMLALCVIVCFYISFMVLIFLLLFVGASLIFAENRGKICVKFLISSGIAALISSIAFLPLLAGYLSSARTVASIVENVRNSAAATDLNQMLPILLGGAALVPFFFMKKPERGMLPYLITLAFVLVPFFYEPINLLWQTGSYMAFPMRYGFIAEFLIIAVAAYALSPKEEAELLSPLYQKLQKTWQRRAAEIAVFVLALFGAAAVLFYTFGYLKDNGAALAKYRSLYPGKEAFSAVAKYYIPVAIGGAVLFALYRAKLLRAASCGVLALCLAFSQGWFGAQTFLAMNANTPYPYTYDAVLELENANLTAEQNFWRIRGDLKYYPVNLMGAAGFYTTSHYTSLTDADYHRLGRILGYESDWMEIGAYNGNALTDAILCNRYTFYYGRTADNVEYYDPRPTPYCFPLGIVTGADLSEKETVFTYDRVDYLRSLAKDLFPNEDPIVKYEDFAIKNINYSFEKDGLHIRPTGGDAHIVFTVNVTEKQMLYLDVFDTTSFDLTGRNFDYIEVYANGVKKGPRLQNSQDNGFYSLGTYENCTVTVDLSVKRSFTLVLDPETGTKSSASVFGIKTSAMERMEKTVISPDMKLSGNTYSGSVTAKEGDWLFLSVPFLKGFSATVNGKAAETVKTYDGFTAVKLSEGTNDVKLTYFPDKLGLGIAFFVIGVVLFAVFVVISKKEWYNRFTDRKAVRITAIVLTAALSVAVVAAIYAAPVLIRLIR